MSVRVTATEVKQILSIKAARIWFTIYTVCESTSGLVKGDGNREITYEYKIW
jgi:hypothetical protein